MAPNAEVPSTTTYIRHCFAVIFDRPLEEDDEENEKPTWAIELEPGENWELVGSTSVFTREVTRLEQQQKQHACHRHISTVST